MISILDFRLPILDFRFSILIFVLFVVSVPIASRAHEVGEPELEKSQVWQNCCRERDCAVQRVEIIGEGVPASKVDVVIEGIRTLVEKQKFHPAPSTRTWVCYYGGRRAVKDENIRCVLYPEKGGMV